MSLYIPLCEKGDFDLEIMDLGRISYTEAYKLQLDMWEKRVKGEIPDTLVLCEHDPVFTVGRRGPSEIPEKLGDVPMVKVERGGSITYHGPGQVMGYIFVDASTPKYFGPKKIYEYLGNGLIQTCKAFSVETEMRSDPRGLWTKEAPGRKLGSFGIAIRSNVTFHGFCLNVEPNFEHFKMISPCDLSPTIMSSVNKERSSFPMDKVSLKDAKDVVIQYFISN